MNMFKKNYDKNVHFSNTNNFVNVIEKVVLRVRDSSDKRESLSDRKPPSNLNFVYVTFLNSDKHGGCVSV